MVAHVLVGEIQKFKVNATRHTGRDLIDREAEFEQESRFQYCSKNSRTSVSHVSSTEKRHLTSLFRAHRRQTRALVKSLTLFRPSPTRDSQETSFLLANKTPPLKTSGNITIWRKRKRTLRLERRHALLVVLGRAASAWRACRDYTAPTLCSEPIHRIH